MSNFTPSDDQLLPISDSKDAPEDFNPKILSNKTNDKSQEMQFDLSPEIIKEQSFSLFRIFTSVRLKFFWRSLPRPFRRTFIAIPGITLVCSGFVMLIIPGPGLLAIIAGVSILALEFHWAKRLQRYLYNLQHKVVGRRKSITRGTASLEKAEPTEVDKPSNTLVIPPKWEK